MTTQNLDFDTLDYRNHKELYFQLKEEKQETLDLDFGLYPDITKARYLVCECRFLILFFLM